MGTMSNSAPETNNKKNSIRQNNNRRMFDLTQKGK
jgi:hypothetical protein